MTRQLSLDTIATLEKFITTVKRAVQAHSKDIRLEITDATLLMSEITNILTRLAVYEHSTVKETTNTTVIMDGGSFT